MYCTTQDLADRLGVDVLGRLAPATTEGADYDSARVELAIEDAQGVVDSYLMQRYTTPVVPVPGAVAQNCMDIAVYNLYSRRGFDPERDAEIKRARDAAVAWLRDVAAGKASIGAASPSKDLGAEVVGPERIFSRTTMGSM